jgi:hypothetical protein
VDVARAVADVGPRAPGWRIASRRSLVPAATPEERTGPDGPPVC